MNHLSEKISELNRVGKVLSSQLSRIGIRTIRDLLFYLPFRYVDFSLRKEIADLVAGEIVTVEGLIESIQELRIFKRNLKMTKATIGDGSGVLNVVWFNMPYIAKQLKKGDQIEVSGKVTIGKYGTQMSNPLIHKSQVTNHDSLNGILPVYHLSGRLTQGQLRFLTKQALRFAVELEDWLPQAIRDEYDLLSHREAVPNIHFPPDLDVQKKALRRFQFEELMLLQLRSILIKDFLKSAKGKALRFFEEEVKSFVENLPFQLTKDQKVSAWEILQDLQKSEPMNRLLEGDVGSGKTVVAAIALYNTILNKQQGALMCPTEILATQHYQNLLKLMGARLRGLALLTGSQQLIDGEKIEKKDLQEKIKNGEATLIIGTHALLSEKVYFKSLGLAVIDEQHRFGVEQRKTLKEKNKGGFVTHLLSMTATPIPRTMSLVAYGDLDISLLKEMPANRKKINTEVCAESDRKRVYQFIQQEVVSGRQVFIVCPRIDESDVFGEKSVKAEFEVVKKAFPKAKVAMLHGKLKGDEKEAVMANFKARKSDILVATAVIEVGVDVPNATVMIIEDAQKFGLAQLHQFRGRVGRGADQSYCFLFSGSNPSSLRRGGAAPAASGGGSVLAPSFQEGVGGGDVSRLKLLELHHDGFTLAEYDLKFRGAGDIYGMRQSGFSELKVANLNDVELIKQSKEAAVKLLALGIKSELIPNLMTHLE